MNPCDAFRRDLEAALVGTDDLRALGWHEHLLGCGDCKALLEQEEALELLLTSLPRPALPPELARRVLARLRSGTLDELLGLDQVRVPAGLSARVLGGLPSRQASTSLDRLLDRADDVAVPDGLAARVLEGLAAERVAPDPPARGGGPARHARRRVGPGATGQPLRTGARARAPGRRGHRLAAGARVLG